MSAKNPSLPRYLENQFEDQQRKAMDITLPGLEFAVEFIRDNLDPQDVFSESALESWAEKNGFIKEEDE